MGTAAGRIQGICRLVLDNWKQGVRLDRQTLCFCESTYGINPSENLEALLDPEQFEERDTFLELVLFPDHDLRVLAEPLLSNARLTQQEVGLLVREVTAARPLVRLKVPGRKSLPAVLVPEICSTAFVRRLYADNTPCRRICDAADSLLPRDLSLEARVRFRVSSPVTTQRDLELLVCLFQRHERLGDDFLKGLELCLRLLGDADPGLAAEDVLLQALRNRNRRISRIQDFEKRSGKWSMEYLMLNRYPVPPESREAVQEEKRLLEHLLRTLLGIVAFDAPLPREVDLGVMDSQTGMERISRLFESSRSGPGR